MELALGSFEFALLAGIFGVGILLGFSLSRRAARRAALRVGELEVELESSRREQAAYRGQVGSHFGRTSELLRDLTIQYRSIYDHLAEGAEQLASDGGLLLGDGAREALPSGTIRVPGGETQEAIEAAASTDVEEPNEAPLPETMLQVNDGASSGRSLLFLCSGNSCRSQIAEGFARSLETSAVQIYSAGTKPSGLNPGAIATMAEAGVDIRSQHSKDISEIPLEEIDVVVTLCGDARERCPAFPSTVERVHWPVRDPSGAEGTEDEVAQIFRDVRDEIDIRVTALFDRSDLFGAPDSA